MAQWVETSRFAPRPFFATDYPATRSTVDFSADHTLDFSAERRGGSGLDAANRATS